MLRRGDYVNELLEKHPPGWQGLDGRAATATAGTWEIADLGQGTGQKKNPLRRYLPLKLKKKKRVCDLDFGRMKILPRAQVFSQVRSGGAS